MSTVLHKQLYVKNKLERTTDCQHVSRLISVYSVNRHAPLKPVPAGAIVQAWLLWDHGSSLGLSHVHVLAHAWTVIPVRFGSPYPGLIDGHLGGEKSTRNSFFRWAGFRGSSYFNYHWLPWVFPRVAASACWMV